MVKKKTLMIVDDEVLIALHLEKLLERHGYDAVSVPSGGACLRKVAEGFVPDLILMDINLGERRMDGPETTRCLQCYADIPVILHSAYTDQKTIQATRDMTKYGYIHKVPGNEEFVLATVEMAFKLREREEKYRALSAHVTRLREEQSAHIAREIHDDLGQSIAALKMNLTMLERSLPEGQRPPMIADMREILDATALKVRSLIQQLRPPVLDTADVVEALRWHSRDFEKSFGISVDFHSDVDSLSLEPEHSLSVFRVVQEALTNSARHGSPSAVSLSIGLKGGNLEVTVLDDGRGFCPEDIAPEGTYGILGMRERAEQWNGSIVIESAPGRGTRFTAVFPVIGGCP